MSRSTSSSLSTITDITRTVFSFSAPSATDDKSPSTDSEKSSQLDDTRISIPPPSPIHPRHTSIVLSPTSLLSTTSDESTPSKRIIIKGSKNHKTGSAHSSYQSQSFPRIRSIVSPNLNDLWPSFLSKLDEEVVEDPVENATIIKVDVVKVTRYSKEEGGGGFLALAPPRARRVIKNKPAPLQISRFSNSTITATSHGSMKSAGSSTTTEKGGKVGSKSRSEIGRERE